MTTPEDAGSATTEMIIGVVGGLSVDHLVSVGAPAAYDQLGGPGLYAALGARLVAGARVRLRTALPVDDVRFGALFDRLGIDVSQAVTTDRVPRCWMLTSSDGRRVVPTASPGPELDLGPSTPVRSSWPGADHREAFVTGLAALAACAPDRLPVAPPGAPVVIDPDQLAVQAGGLDHLRALASAGTVFVPSRVQLRLLDQDPVRAARQIVRQTGRPVIARLDRDGMVAFDGNRAWTIRDAGVEVVETTGAGDASAGAIAASLALGADLPTAAAFGVAVARVALSGVGSAALVTASPFAIPFDGISVDPVITPSTTPSAQESSNERSADHPARYRSLAHAQPAG